MSLKAEEEEEEENNYIKCNKVERQYLSHVRADPRLEKRLITM